MVEEEKIDENKEEVKEEVPKAEPVSPAGASTIEQARTENDRREKLLEREETLMGRKEELEADRIAGGRAEAGVVPEKKKPETDEEFSKRFTDGEVNLFA